MDVHRTVPPGIGLRHEFVTERGRRVGVVSHRTGRREVVVYDRADPDTAAVTLTLNADEANGMAELLASTRVVERLGELHRQVEELVSEQIPIPAGSPTMRAPWVTPAPAPAPARRSWRWCVVARSSQAHGLTLCFMPTTSWW
jgi:TrkA domain protein